MVVEAGKTAAKLVTTVQDCVSTLVTVKLPDIFHKGPPCFNKCKHDMTEYS